jgi:hypothetical protein
MDDKQNGGNFQIVVGGGPGGATARRADRTRSLPRCAMSQGAFIAWKEERDAIHKEMDRLLTGCWLETVEERQVRKIQFMALVERRNDAARKFLKSACCCQASPDSRRSFS